MKTIVTASQRWCTASNTTDRLAMYKDAWKISDIPPLNIYLEGANRSTYSPDDRRTVSTHMLFTFKYYLYLILGRIKHKNLADTGLAILNSTAVNSAKLDSTALV
jgi:hypothetical protein